MWAKDKQHGFTIIELVVVIVVIAILATITIVAYNGITDKAKIASLSSDLHTAGVMLAADNVTNGSYPASAAAANNGQGLKSSPDNTLTYTKDSSNNSYCLVAVNGSLSYYITSSNTSPTPGSCSTQSSTIYTVQTFAGVVGTTGYVNATGTSAKFNYPYAITFDTAGNLYVADAFNNAIRMITPAGVVTTYAGSLSGTAGSANGNGTSATFSSPRGLAFDSAGNLYVADSGNNLIRKITPAKDVTTYAGSGASGWADGNGTAAVFKVPTSVVADSSGNVYVVDNFNNMIRKISPTRDVTTFAGSTTAGSADGTGTAAQFNSPYAVAIDTSNTLYVADKGNKLIRKITSAGVVNTFAGSGAVGSADGTGTAASFNFPYGIATDTSGNIYVSDTSNDLIRKITSAGVVSTIAGSGSAGSSDGVGNAASFQYPYGIVMGADGALYVADQGNQLIRKITIN